MVGDFGFFRALFTLVPIIIFIGFVAILGSLLFRVVQKASDRTKPVLPVLAVVVAKREHISRHHHGEGMSHFSTTYFTAFEFQNGERIELEIPGEQYGLLREGDRGTLFFQGKSFVKFEREKMGETGSEEPQR